MTSLAKTLFGLGVSLLGVLAFAQQVTFKDDFEGFALSFQFDESAAVSTTMGNDGGSLFLPDVGPGIDIGLTIPSASLLEEQLISMTPVIRVEGGPAGFHPLAAVRLGPEGQALGAPAIVTFSIPQPLRPGELAVGFFTNDDGSELYLTPLKDAGGTLVFNAAAIVASSKTGFSVAGAGSVDEDFDMPPKNPEQQLLDVINGAVNCQLLGCDLPPGGYSESDIEQLTEILAAWNKALRDRLARLFDDFSLNGVTERNTADLLGIVAERSMLAGYLQAFPIPVGAIPDLISESELTSALDQFIKGSYDLCITTDEEAARKSEALRLDLANVLQLLDVNTALAPGDQLCQYEVDLQPPYTALDSPTEEAVVNLSVRAFNPLTLETIGTVPGASFTSPAVLTVESSANVPFVQFEPNGNELRFLVEGPELGTVTVSGGSQVINSATASARLAPDFAGQYTLTYDVTESGCTDPDDDGAYAGSFGISMSASTESISENVVVHNLSGSSGGAVLNLRITETIGSTTGPVSGGGSYSGSESEVDLIDGELVRCTYFDEASGNLGGTADFAGDSVTIDVSISDASSSYTSSPAICGTGSCSDINGSLTLTRD